MSKKPAKLKKKSPLLREYQTHIDGKKVIVYAENSKDAIKAINLLIKQNEQRNRKN